jgi:hypothetical protein
MERSIKKSNLIISAFIVLIFYSCGRNVKYTEKIDYTKKVQLKDINCNDGKIKIKLKELSVFNTERDTFLFRSHMFLSLYIKLNIINNGDEDLPFSIGEAKDDFYPFKWILDEKDTVNFYDYNLKTKYLIKSKDSLDIFLSTPSREFEILFKEQDNYTKDVLSVMPDFKLIYIDRKKDKICVSQNSDTKIIISNSKSKWSWW